MKQVICTILCTEGQNGCLSLILGFRTVELDVDVDVVYGEFGGLPATSDH